MIGMRNSNLLGKITVFVFICFFGLSAQGKYGGGTGEPEEPYLIYTAEQMNEIGLSVNWDDLDKHFLLCADIDLGQFTAEEFNIIGTSWDNVFTGVFDGNGHTISNFTYTSTGTDHIGIFGYVDCAGVAIKDLGLAVPNIDAGNKGYIGSLIGYLKDGTISNCYVEGGSLAGRYCVGGLVGFIWYGTITNCYSSGDVSGEFGIGGLVGYNYGTITNSYATGSVEADDGYSGGLVGHNDGADGAGIISGCYARVHVSVRNDDAGGLVGRNKGTVTNCYSTGSVSGDRYIGGLVGENYKGTVTNCYSTGTVSGDLYIGGLVGENDQGTVTASFWDFQTSAPSTSDGGFGLTTAEMQTATTFIEWGCENVWTINEGVDYPRLIWENAPGEPITTPSYGGGSGEPHDPYLIYTAEQLNTIGLVPCHLDKHFLLCADIDLDTLPPPPPSHPPSLFKASNPNPAHGAYSVGTTADLSWTACLGATSHDVYFGTTSIPPFVCNQTSTTFDPGTIALGAKYYWHIDEVNDSVITAGEIWNFTTIPSPPPTSLSLMVDVDLGQFDGENTRPRFNVIGHKYYDGGWVGDPFTGVFDGNDHTISNFTYTSTDRDYIGLFGYVRGGVIRNLGLIDPNVDAGTGYYVSLLVGYLDDGTINNCYVEGGSVDGRRNVGGLVGRNSLGSVTNSYSTGSVSGERYVGGLVGENYKGTVTNSYSTGGVSGDEDVGGLAGYNLRSTIDNSYSTASVTGDQYVGGFVGRNSYGTISTSYAKGGASGYIFVGGLVGSNFADGTITSSYSTASVSGDRSVGGLVGSNEGTIINCYSTGSVSGYYHVGGLVGENYDYSMVSASFWDVNTSGQATSAGGTGLPTARMHMASTFIEWGACGDEGIWTLEEGNDYPHLWWEEKPGELLPVYQLSDFITGAGTQSDPYLVYTDVQLNIIGMFLCDWDKHFKLMADINLSNFTGKSFNIIGGSWRVPFTGVFDGNGRKIFNFTYTSNEKSYIGLFSIIDGENAVIKDLGLIDPDVDAGSGSYVGSLVACLEDGSISNCYVEGGSASGDRYVGGLVGYSDGDIADCYATGSVFGDYSVGGLVGYNTNVIVDCYTSGNVTRGNYAYSIGGLCGKSTGPDHGTGQSRIQNCYSTATVTGNGSAGGLIGHSGAIVTGCYSRGSVSGDYYVGGLIGRNGGNGSISNCYSTGSVVGEQSDGGLVGENIYHSVVSGCFWDIETSGQVSSDGGTGKTTAEMQMMSTFTNVGWDFVGETVNGIEDIWFIGQQDYPHMWWEGMQVPMKLTPRTLNCRSEGNWLKAHLTLPQGFTVEDVDSNKPAVLHSFGFESAPLYVFVNKNGQVQIEAAFEREAVCSLTGDWPDTLTVAGFLADSNIFLGTSTVRIIHPGMKVIEELASCWLQGDCVHPDFCNEIDMNRDSLVNLLDYALLMNINVEFVTDE